MRQRCPWSLVLWSPVVRAALKCCCCAALLLAPLARASDFVEAQQEVPDSRHRASAPGSPVDPAILARRDAMKAASTAHANCVRDVIDRGSDANGACVKTRAAYAALLPQDYAALEVSILERKVQQLAAPTKQ